MFIAAHDFDGICSFRVYRCAWCRNVTCSFMFYRCAMVSLWHLQLQRAKSVANLAVFSNYNKKSRIIDHNPIGSISLISLISPICLISKSYKGSTCPPTFPILLPVLTRSAATYPPGLAALCRVPTAPSPPAGWVGALGAAERAG